MKRRLMKIFMCAVALLSLVMCFTSCESSNTVFGNLLGFITGDDGSQSDNEHTHTFGEWTVDTAASCTEAGKEKRVCADEECGHYEVRDIPASGHSLTNHEAKSASCTEAGYAAYETCSDCSYTTYKEIPANGHSLINHESKAPSCTEVGWNEYAECDKCFYTTYEEIPATGHSLNEHEAKTASCTEAGYSAYESCDNCSYTTYEEIPATGHSYEGGACSSCGAPDPYYGVETATYTVTVKNAEDASLEGIKVYIYSNEEILKYSVTDANGCAVFELPVDLSCIIVLDNVPGKYSAEEYYSFTDKNANIVLNEHNHTYENGVCTGCGEEHDHSFSEWQGNTATCTEGGEETRTCVGCGLTESQTTEPKGHTYEEGTCADCGESETPDYILPVQPFT